MAKVDGTSDLLATLRGQLTGRSGKTSASRSRDVDGMKSTSQEAIGPEALQERIGSELKLVDLVSPSGKKKARQIFIESVLAWDLGEGLLADGQFGRVVRDVEESIASDPRLSEQLDQLLMQLQGASGSST